jgi:aminoglycoside/choline kinase family phosphotransferase
VTGPTRGVRFMPWSAVLRAPTSEGDVYFKACGPSQAHEPALAALLYAARPDCMIPVLAADLERGWLLTADGGATLTEAIRTGDDESGHWSRVLALIAGVQRELTPRTGELLALGVPERRPAALAALFADLVTLPEVFLMGEPGALSGAQLAQLQALAPRVAAWAAELAALGPPDTYFHDDFHEDHVFAHRRNGGWRYAFFDFGDAGIGHPFLQLVSHPRFSAARFQMRGDPVIERLQENYLGSWRDCGGAAELRRALDLALILGCIARALTWVNACADHLDQLPDFLRDAYRTKLAFWMMQTSLRGEAVDGPD